VPITAIYVHYNASIGANSETTREGANQMMVTMQAGNRKILSRRHDAGEDVKHHMIPNCENSGKTLGVKVHNIDTLSADVSVCLGECPDRYYYYWAWGEDNY
jgi:hypothetical protein